MPSLAVSDKRLTPCRECRCHKALPQRASRAQRTTLQFFAPKYVDPLTAANRPTFSYTSTLTPSLARPFSPSIIVDYLFPFSSLFTPFLPFLNPFTRMSTTDSEFVFPPTIPDSFSPAHPNTAGQTNLPEE